MPTALRGLLANLAAGLRLALGLPVARPSFRIDAAQLVLLMAVSALVDVGIDWLRQGPGTAFDASAVGGELASFALLMLAAALLAWVSRDAALVLALPVVVFSSMPLVQASHALPVLLALAGDERAWLGEVLPSAILVWFLFVLGRSAFVVLAPHALRPLRALAATVMLSAPLFIADGLLPDALWWRAQDAASLDPANPAAEPILSLQRELQDEALAALGEHVQGETDLYFVGFAPDGDGATWHDRLAAARRMMDGHWGTEGRSLVYVNDASRLTEAPIASVTHLREALDEIAAASNPDEDVVMLYVAGRSNADGSLAVRLPPLGLVQLSGPGLASLLKQAGLKWRVIVLATCAPQPFLDALGDENTLIIAAAGAGQGARGCGRGEAPTAFGDVLFGEALATAATLPAAFAAAHAKLAAQGPAPVIHVGGEIGAQLARLRSVPGGRASSGAQPRG